MLFCCVRCCLDLVSMHTFVSVQRHVMLPTHGSPPSELMVESHSGKVWQATGELCDFLSTRNVAYVKHVVWSRSWITHSDKNVSHYTALWSLAGSCYLKTTAASVSESCASFSLQDSYGFYKIVLSTVLDLQEAANSTFSCSRMECSFQIFVITSHQHTRLCVFCQLLVLSACIIKGLGNFLNSISALLNVFWMSVKWNLLVLWLPIDCLFFQIAVAHCFQSYWQLLHHGML